ncbi:hypothetical protein [Enterobacter sp. Bisph1]|uniref:hypothetical protein n=1 Tax=Enterobacter sp. Bisph1 TaxID=1274399 RepID=UPI0009E2A7EC|nr:hypothetical protein [Enterobacter sp. Bisph1]
MQDLFVETLTTQRIGLLLKLVALSDCTGSEKDLAFSWLTELAPDLENRLENFELKNPPFRIQLMWWKGLSVNPAAYV